MWPNGAAGWCFPFPTWRSSRWPRDEARRRTYRRGGAMKVVLFCGGYGMRMRTGTPGDVPKPMQMVGPRPLIWHVMRYYAHFGHTDFILCLGYGAHHIKDFFLTYQETTSNDFVLRDGRIELLS